MEGYRSMAWRLEYGVTDTRRFEDIPYIDDDEDELNLKADRREIYCKDTQGYTCTSMAAWELEYGVTDTRRFDDIHYIDENDDANSINGTGPANIDIKLEDKEGRTALQLDKELNRENTTKTDIIESSVRTVATPLETITTTTHSQKVMDAIRIKLGKISRGRRVIVERTNSWRMRISKPFKSCFKH